MSWYDGHRRQKTGSELPFLIAVGVIGLISNFDLLRAISLTSSEIVGR